MVLYSCVISVFQVAFEIDSENENENLEAYGFWYYFDMSVEFLFVLDILLNFIHAYQHPETSQDVRNPKEIAKNYIFNGWFVIDTIAIIPFDEFIQQGKIAKLLRLFRLPRLAKLFSM